MRILKFDLMYKDVRTGEASHNYFTLSEIAEGKHLYLTAHSNLVLVAERQYYKTNAYDQDIYEGDILGIDSYRINAVIGWNAKVGCYECKCVGCDALCSPTDEENKCKVIGNIFEDEIALGN